MAKSRKIGLKMVKLSQKSIKKAFLKSKFFNFFKILVATCEYKSKGFDNAKF